MESNSVTVKDEVSMRWDLLESQPPIGTRFTARLAVPNRSTEVFIAVDAGRRRYVLVRIPNGEPCSIAERTSRGIAVQTVEIKLDKADSNGVFVEIVCLEQSGYAALDIVTIELVEAIAAGLSIGRVHLVQSVLTKWRRFWSGVAQTLLSREQQFGLFGELWFLKRWLMPSVGSGQAVTMWRGPVGARNDFEQLGLAVEVKTTGKLNGSHLINGLEQLLEPPGVNLLLFSLLVRDEASGTESLPNMVLEIRNTIAEDHLVLSKFEAMLAASGYEDTYADEYNKLKLRIRGQGLYQISPGFPRLIPSSILPGLPVGVTNLTYELRLDAAGNWLVGESPVSCSLLLQELASGRSIAENQ